MIDPVLETIESLKRRAREHTNKEIAELFKRRHLTDSTVFYARYSSIIGGLEALATVGLIGLTRYTRYIDFAGKILLHRSDWLRRREEVRK